jgi:hypothetical protein
MGMRVRESRLEGRFLEKEDIEGVVVGNPQSV